MKKILFVILALLLTAGVVKAANIPQMVSPETAGEKWITEVYYNSATNCTKGDVLIWDIGSSTGDDYMYVTTTTTAGTGPVAGVADADIVGYSVGPIVIYGLTDVNTPTSQTAAVVAGNTVQTSISAGKGRAGSSGLYTLGVAQGATSSNVTPVFVNPN